MLRSHLAEMSEAANRLAPYTVLGWSPDELDDRAEKQAEARGPSPGSREDLRPAHPPDGR